MKHFIRKNDDSFVTKPNEIMLKMKLNKTERMAKNGHQKIG